LEYRGRSEVGLGELPVVLGVLMYGTLVKSLITALILVLPLVMKNMDIGGNGKLKYNRS